MDKADLVPGLLGAGFQPLVAALRVDEGMSKLAERVVPCARHLGGIVNFNLSVRLEIDKRRNAMKAGWSRLGNFWTSHCHKRVKRSVLYASVVAMLLHDGF